MATVVNKDLLKSLRPAIDAALAAVAAAHGLESLKAGNASFDPVAGTFTFKLEGVAAGAMGKDASRYVSHIGILGLPPHGAVFQSGPDQFKTDGLNSTGSKIIAVRPRDGKRFLFPVNTCIALCKVAA